MRSVKFYQSQRATGGFFVSVLSAYIDNAYTQLYLHGHITFNGEEEVVVEDDDDSLVCWLTSLLDAGNPDS